MYIDYWMDKLKVLSAWNTIQHFKIKELTADRCTNVNEPQNIMLWESQTQNSTYFMIPFTWNF